MRDNTHSIIRSAGRFFSGTMLSRISGLLRDIAMAYAFGTQSAVAALLVAFRFAHLLRRLLGEGALQTAFIPHFEGLRRDDPARATQFFFDLNLSLCYLLAALVALVSAALGLVYAFGNLSPGNAEIVWLTLLMMPSLLFICLFGINASLLQCEKSYFVPSAAPVAFNAVWLAGVFCVYHLEASQAMSWLAGFIVLACLCQWAATLPKTYRILKEYHLSFLWQRSKSFSSDVILLAKPLALGIVGVAAAQINSALDAVFARWADPQGPALLWYAIRLQQLPLALFGIAIAGAILPPLARAIKAGDWGNYRFFLDFALRRSIALMLPISAALFVVGDSCVNIIYGHGDFTDASIAGTTRALWGYSCGLLPMTLVLVMAPAFYAQGDYRTPSMASLCAVAVNALLNLVLVGGFGLGAASVALATGISAWVNLFWLGYVLNRRHGAIFSAAGIQSACKIAAASLAASVATVVASAWLLGKFSVLQNVQGTIPHYPRGFEEQLVELAALGATFLVSLLAAAFAVGASDLLTVWKVQDSPPQQAKES